MPRKIRQLIADLENAEFQLVPGGKDRIESFAMLDSLGR